MYCMDPPYELSESALIAFLSKLVHNEVLVFADGQYSLKK